MEGAITRFLGCSAVVAIVNGGPGEAQVLRDLVEGARAILRPGDRVGAGDRVTARRKAYGARSLP